MNLPGVFPSDALCALRRLSDRVRIPEVEVLAIELDAASLPRYHSRSVSETKRFIEHPIDFEWRFTQQGVARICEEISGVQLRPNAKILCLGCPSVFSFGSRNLKPMNFQLWDKNTRQASQLEEAQEVYCTDLTQGTPSHKPADLVVIDPPWYNDYYYLFLWAAFHCLPVGGHVLLSFPPEGTRASVADDLRALTMWCTLRGLRLEKRQQSCLPYRSPLFEVNALRGLGVSNYPLNWRRGDLIVLKKESANSFPKPVVLLLQEKWEEIHIQNCRIKFCRSRRPGSAELESVGTTDVLASVSSRNKLRKRANVVTSGNRFLSVKSIDDLLACLADIQNGGDGNGLDQPFASKNPLLMRKALYLISKEQKEAALYFRRINEL